MKAILIFVLFVFCYVSSIAQESNYSVLKNVPLKKIMQNKFKLPVFLDNDAKCFTLGEAIFGNGKKHENVVGITLGTGFGCGLVIHKKIYHGRSNATELSSTTIKYDGVKSKSGNSGSIEEYVAARGITALFGGKTSPKEIYNLALKGNKKAIKAYKKRVISEINKNNTEIQLVDPNFEMDIQTNYNIESYSKCSEDG